MNAPKPLRDWLHSRNMAVAELASSAGLDPKVVAAIADQRYTTSPQQRQRLADALGLAPEQIAWGNTVPVDHMYGHGPQFGRSP
jgi:lambda repressor-like predicted transcriptional regulator